MRSVDNSRPLSFTTFKTISLFVGKSIQIIPYRAGANRGSVRGASSLSQVYSQLACRVGRSRPCTAPLTQGQKVEEGMLPSADIERSKFGANSSRIRTYHILQENGKLGMPLFVMFHL